MATRGLRHWPYTKACPEDLPPAELILLDAVRAWETARRRGEQPLHRARMVLETEGVAVAAQALDGLLKALADARPPQLGCVLCPRLIGDEPLLLTAIALVQRQARGEALAMLLRLLPPPGAYAAMAATVPLGYHFRTAGLRFSDPWSFRGPA
jgi:hypothetical protein